MDSPASEMAAKPRAERLTIRRIIGDFIRRFVLIEQNWWKTSKSLLSRPEEVIRSYIGGERNAYSPPITYMVINYTVSLLLQSWSGYSDKITKSASPAMPGSPDQVVFINDLMGIVQPNILYLSFIIIIPFGIALYFFFSGKGYNMAEMIVVALYVTGFAAFFGIAATVFNLVIESSIMVTTLVVLGVGMAYYAYVMIRLVGGTVGTTLLTSFAWLLGYVTFIMLIIVFTVVYLIIFRDIEGAEEWDLKTATEAELPLVVEHLIKENGLNPNQLYSTAPLHEATRIGSGEIVDVLLENGAEIDIRDHMNSTPLLDAIWRGHEAVALKLLSAGASPDAVNDSSVNAVHLAVLKEMDTVLEQILVAGADPNVKRPGKLSATPLILAVRTGNTSAVELLLTHDADPLIENYEGKTAYEYANAEMLALLPRRPVREEPAQAPAEASEESG